MTELTLSRLRSETRILTREYYARPTIEVAKDLLGKVLVHGETAGRIVEVEAYPGGDDLASHSARGITDRTRVIFGPPGHAYVFFIYGMHECFNVVAFGEGKGHAVLVRAGEPVLGIEHGVRASGPGLVCKALGITRAKDGHDLTTPPLFLSARRGRPRIATSARVGVAYAGEIAEAPWRFFEEGSPHVSRPNKKSIGLGRS